MYERDDKDTQDGINRLRDLIKLRSYIAVLTVRLKPASFVLNVVCMSAQKSYRLIGISPPHRLFPRDTHRTRH